VSRLWEVPGSASALFVDGDAQLLHPEDQVVVEAMLAAGALSVVEFARGPLPQSCHAGPMGPEQLLKKAVPEWLHFMNRSTY